MCQPNDKLRTFCPIILFHDRNSECSQVKDENYYELIKNKKKRIQKMLDENSRYWRGVKERSREYEKFEQQFRLYDGKLLPDQNSSLPTSPILTDSLYTHQHNHHQDQSLEGPLIKPTKRRRGNLPKSTTALLKSWLAQHKKHPYPTEEEKMYLARKTELNLQQISNWFINARRRHLPHLLNNDYPTGGQPHNNAAGPRNNPNEMEIYTYEGSENSDSTSDNGCHMRRQTKCQRIQKGAIKKPHHMRRRKTSL